MSFVHLHVEITLQAENESLALVTLTLVYSKLSAIFAYLSNTVNFCQGTFFSLGNNVEINVCHTETISMVKVLKNEDY